MSEPRFTLDYRAQASRPAKIKFNPLVWCFYDPLKVSALLIALVLTVLLAIVENNLYFLGTLVVVFASSWYWTGVKEHFTADSNPGEIISVSPPLFAVYTDLTKGDGYYPVVKIEKFKSRRKVSVGDKLATIATYEGYMEEEYSAWNDFFPLPLEYATRNKKDIEAELSRYDNLAWEKLTAAVERVRDIRSPGLYYLHNPESDWEK